MTCRQCLHLLWLIKWKKCNNFQEFKVGSHPVECADFRIHVKAPGFQPDQPSWSDWFRTIEVKKRENLSHFWFFKAENCRFQRSDIANCTHSDPFSCELMNFFTYKFPIISTYNWSLQSSCFLWQQFSHFPCSWKSMQYSANKITALWFRRYNINVKAWLFLLSSTFWTKINYSCFNFLA